jgi:hypothetical protein
LPKGIGQAVLLKLDMKDNCARLVPDRVEHHWNTIMMIEPTPHMAESACQLCRIDP